MAMSQTWMEGFQTRARAALETALSRLDPQWSILAELRIDGPGDDVAADYVAIHPVYGIALIDAGSTGAGDQTERLRTLLDGQKFATFFPGNLPIVRLAVRPADAALIGRRLDAAFAKAPPLTIDNPDWAAAVQDLLVPIDATAPAPASGAKPPPTRPETPERRSAAPGSKTRPAADKPKTQASSTEGQAVWSVASGANPTSAQPQVDHGDASPSVGSISEPVAPKQKPAPEQPRADRGEDVPRAGPMTDSDLADAKPVAARDSGGNSPATDPISEPVASDEPPAPAPQDVDRHVHASPTGAIAEPIAPAEKPAPLPSSLEPSAEIPRLDRARVGDERRIPEPLRLDRAGDMPRARAVTGGELVARRDDAIVAPRQFPAARQWQWATVAAVLTLVLGGASWWAFSGAEQPAAGRAVADILPSRPLDRPLPAEISTPSPAAPSIVPAAPEAGTVAALSAPPPAAVDADAHTTSPDVASQASPPLAISPSLSTPSARSAPDKPAAAMPPVNAPDPTPVTSASPTVTAKSSTTPPPTSRPRPAPPKPALVSAKSSIAAPQAERTAPHAVSETRSVSLQSNNPLSPPSPPASARYDRPPLGVADLPPLDPPARPSSADTAVAAAAPAGLHGPTSLLPPTSMAAAAPPGPPTEVCRAYTSMKTLLGQSRPVSGVTCRGQDGQWHIITELPN